MLHSTTVAASDMRPERVTETTHGRHMDKEVDHAAEHRDEVEYLLAERGEWMPLPEPPREH